MFNMSNTTVATSGAGTTYPSGAHDFISGFSRIHVAQSLVFCVILVERFFVFCFGCGIVLLWFTNWNLVESEAKLLPLTHIYMTAHFPDNVAELNYLYKAQTSPISEIMRSWKYYLHMRKMPNIIYNWRGSGGSMS